MNLSLIPSTTCVISCKELQGLGINHGQILQLRKEGLLMREGRGVYTLINNDITEYHNLAVVSK